MKKTIQLLQSKWREYLIEMLVIIAGIWLALALGNWNEHRKDRQLEQKILKQLHAEFQQNKTQFERVTSKRFQNMDYCQKLMNMFPIDVKTANLDSIAYYLKYSGFRGTFNPSQGAINSLISSSSFDIISDEKLRALLIEWKDLVGDYLEDEAIADHHLVNYWEPYLNKNFIQRRNHQARLDDIYDSRADLSFLESIEFENLVIRRWLNYRRVMSPDEEVHEIDLVKNAIDEILELTANK